MRAPLGTFSAALVLAFAATVAAEVTPLPPAEDRSVFDTADVITPTHEQDMESLHAQLVARTGVAIAVVTIPRLVNETLSEFAVRFGHERGLGRKGEDRGIVIALSTGDREVFVATGYGVEGYLPDGRVGGLIDQYAVPHLARDEFSSGLFALSAALARASAEEFQVELTAAPTLAPEQQRPRGCSLGQALIGLLFAAALLFVGIRHPHLLIWLLILMGSRRGGGFGSGGFGGGGGFGGFGGGGFGGGGAGRGF